MVFSGSLSGQTSGLECRPCFISVLSLNKLDRIWRIQFAARTGSITRQSARWNSPPVRRGFLSRKGTMASVVSDIQLSAFFYFYFIFFEGFFLRKKMWWKDLGSIPVRDSRILCSWYFFEWLLVLGWLRHCQSLAVRWDEDISLIQGLIRKRSEISISSIILFITTCIFLNNSNHCVKEDMFSVSIGYRLGYL